MLQEHVILETQVTHEGRTYTASYFVEHARIHANIAGRYMLLPVGRMPTETTVQAVLLGTVQHHARRNQRANEMVAALANGSLRLSWGMPRRTPQH